MKSLAIVSLLFIVGCGDPGRQEIPFNPLHGEIMPEHQDAIDLVHEFFNLDTRLPVYWLTPNCPDSNGFIYGQYGCIGGVMLAPDGILLTLSPNQKRHSDWSGLTHEVAHYWLEVTTGDSDPWHLRREVWGENAHGFGYPTYGKVFEGMQHLRQFPDIDTIKHRIVVGS